jgi:hypothetical protein
LEWSVAFMTIKAVSSANNNLHMKEFEKLFVEAAG